MLTHEIYYLLKPFTPRWLQLGLRRIVALKERALHANVWPIDEGAKKEPDGWPGWPDKKRFALVLTHDVETEAGQEKCIPLASLEESLGFSSSFNFVAEECKLSPELLRYLDSHGFEVGVHGLYHDGNLFKSRRKFQKQAVQINYYLKEWSAVGFRCPSMYHNLDWIHDLNIEYDASTFDTDPFEPQRDGVKTIFPFWVQNNNGDKGYVELPYTLPQDFTLFVLMKERNIEIWKRKLDWIVKHGGMALFITHPDYMNCEEGRGEIEKYPMEFYKEFLDYVKSRYEGQYWSPLPKEMARFWKEKMVEKERGRQ
jgi:hypothetical protein